MSTRSTLTITHFSIALFALISLSFFALFLSRDRYISIQQESLQKQVIEKIDKFNNHIEFLNSQTRIIRDHLVIRNNILGLISSVDKKSQSKPDSVRDLDEQIKILINEVTDIDNLLLTDLTGRVVYSTDQADVGKFIKDIYLGYNIPPASITKKNEIYYHPSLAEKAHYDFIFSSSIRNSSGDDIGYVSVIVNVNKIMDALRVGNGNNSLSEVVAVKQISSSPAENNLFYDSKGGSIVYLTPTNDDPTAAFSKTVKIGAKKPCLAEESTSGKSGVGAFTDASGLNIVAAWGYVPSHKIGIIVKRDLAETLKPMTDLYPLGLLFGVSLSIIIFVLSITISFFTSPKPSSDINQTNPHLGNEK